ncbi:hypothetical protein Q1695_006184 [Nippostrongylus brasiliensis]|nr:hypothetical protein Q1695_006184 [Nippostrongylus brasiliensis]
MVAEMVVMLESNLEKYNLLESRSKTEMNFEGSLGILGSIRVATFLPAEVTMYKANFSSKLAHIRFHSENDSECGRIKISANRL